MSSDKALPPEQAERLARACSRSVFLSSPVARHPVRQYTLGMIDTVVTLERLGIPWRMNWIVGNSNLPRARNEAAAEFLASGMTDLIFIDDDMGWKPNHVLRLLASTQDFIGGVGRKKTNDPDNRLDSWCCRFKLPLAQDDMGALGMEGIGTGFVRISRRVFETVIETHPELKRHGPAGLSEETRKWYYNFFRFVDDADSPNFSEDYAFCELWKATGGTIWADPDIELIHVGDREFTGSIRCLLGDQS